MFHETWHNYTRKQPPLEALPSKAGRLRARAHARPDELHARDVPVLGLSQMRWDLFDVSKHVMLLEEPAKVLRDSLGRELAVCRLPSGVHYYLVDDVAAVLRPFVEEIEDIVETSDLLNEVLPLRVNRAVKSFKCHELPPFVAFSAGDLGIMILAIKREWLAGIDVETYANWNGSWLCAAVRFRTKAEPAPYSSVCQR